MCHLGSAAKSVSAKSLTFKSVKLSVLQPIFNFVHFLCKYFWLFWLLRDFVRFFQLSVTLGLWLPQQWLLRHPLEWQVAYLWSGTPQPVKQPFSSRRSNQSTNNKQASKSDISAASEIRTNISSDICSKISFQFNCCLTIRTRRNFVGKNILWQRLPTARTCSILNKDVS